MSALNGIESTGPTHAASVWLGEPHWNHLHRSWNRLIALQNTPCAIYQSPSYFEYLAATEGPHKLDLLTVQTQSMERVVGVTPVQKLLFEIPFSIGHHTLFKARVPCLRVLGSEPMVPKTQEAHDQLFALMTKQYPDLSMVEMDAVSVDGFLWQYLFSSPFIRKNYFVHVLHGVRDCHFIHLPSSIEEYRDRLGRKLRHNLERQERVLEKHLKAPLVLTFLNREEQVPIMLRAKKALGAPGCDDWAAQHRLSAATRHGFQYSFILHAGDRIVSMTLGTKSNETYRVHNFYYDKRLEKYSPGTALWHKVLRFLIEDATFKSVDMGYGTPVYSHRSINTIHKRGKVLLFRRTMTNRCLINAITAFSATVIVAKAGAAFAGRCYRAPERQKPATPAG